MSDKITSNGLGLFKEVFVESLDAHVYHPPTDLIPPSPPTSSIIGSLVDQILAKESSMKTDLHKKTYASIKSDDLKDSESKEQTKQSVTESDVKVPHVLSKYAQTYELEKFTKNKMIIFNHYQFSDGGTRQGTMKDEEALRHTFERYRFEIQTYHDLKMSHLIKTIRKFASTDFSSYGCLCVAILTHGYGQPGYLHAFDRRFREDYIFDAFNTLKNPTLVAKPIIFIIEACRGPAPSRKVTTVGPRLELDHDSDDYVYHLPTDADRIVFHSSAVGRASVRHIYHGSWFIQTLCRKIEKYAQKIDFESICRMVRKEVALEFVNSRDWKQMPVVTSTLMRELYFAATDESTPSEDTDCKMHSKFSELEEKPKEPSLKTPDESLDSSQTLVKPTHMPCSCFLEYFEYLKRCLEFFIDDNPKDIVVENLLKMMKKVGDGAEYNLLKLDYIQTVWEHLEANKDKFPPESTKLLYRNFCVRD